MPVSDTDFPGSHVKRTQYAEPIQQMISIIQFQKYPGDSIQRSKELQPGGLYSLKKPRMARFAPWRRVLARTSHSLSQAFCERSGRPSLGASTRKAPVQGDGPTRGCSTARPRRRRLCNQNIRMMNTHIAKVFADVDLPARMFGTAPATLLSGAQGGGRPPSSTLPPINMPPRPWPAEDSYSGELRIQSSIVVEQGSTAIDIAGSNRKRGSK